MKYVVDTLLLASLPAAGKSAIRKFFKETDSEILKEEFHIEKYVAIDDLPYAIFINKIDEELATLKQPGIFYPNGQTHYDSREYGTLTLLLREDYKCLKEHTICTPKSAALYLFERIDQAAEQVGLGRRFAAMETQILNKLARRLEAEAKKIVESNNALFLTPLNGSTIVIELSRGSAEGSVMPLTGPEGYQYALPLLGQEILENLNILYLKIDPKESFQKNLERPFIVPEGVMRRNYGCDDMLYLLGGSSTIALKSEGKRYDVPVTIFDTEKASTSFLYKPQHLWPEKEYALFLDEMKKAAEGLCLNLRRH